MFLLHLLNIYSIFIKESKLYSYVIVFINKTIIFIKLSCNIFRNIKFYIILLLIFIIIYGLFFFFIAYKLIVNHNNELLNIETKSLFNIVRESAIILKDKQSPMINSLNYSKQQITNIYSFLGIANYQDYLLLKTFDAQQLNIITMNNTNVADKLADIGINELFGSHLELITDLNRFMFKALLKLSSPLVAALGAMVLLNTYQVIF